MQKITRLALIGSLIASMIAISPKAHAVPDGPVNCGTSGTFTITGNKVVAGNTTCVGSVVVPEGVTEINYQAFYNYSGLTSVSLPSTLTRINDQAFRSTTITSVNIPANVTYIGTIAFSNNLGTLASVTFEGTAASPALTIAVAAFQYSNLASFTLPANLATLDPTAFDAPKVNLKSLNFLGNAPSVSADFSGLLSNVVTVYANAAATGFTPTTWKGRPFVSVAAPNFSLSSTPQNATVGTAIPTSTVSNTGDTLTSFSISPAISNTPGLTFTSANGSISGTPTTVASSRTYTISARGSLNASGNTTYTITVNAAAVAVAAPVIKLPTLTQPTLKLSIDKERLSWGQLSKLTLIGGVDSGTVTYQNSGDAYCLIDAASKYILTTNYGTCIITAYNSGDSDYIAIQSNSVTILVAEKSTSTLEMTKASSIFFANGRFTLNTRSRSALNKFAAGIKSQPLTQIILHGYTDSKGGTDNTYLSEMRAKTVAAYLKSRGVTTEITLEWFADTNPVDSGTSIASLAKNRRVEIFTK